jgi:hypothetical protein
LFCVEAPTHMAQRDREAVFGLINRLPVPEQQRLLDCGRRRARELLSMNLAMLQGVTDELERTGVMDSTTFEEIAKSSVR